MATVRYLVTDVERSIAFYTKVLGFKLDQSMAPAFARVSNNDLTLWLAGPQSSAARPMPDGRRPEPGGWNRFVVEMEDLVSRVAEMKRAGLRFRNDVVVGPGGKQILLEDPDGNVVELFEAARWTIHLALQPRCGTLASGVEDRAGDEPGPLVALLWRLVAERQADEALAAAVREEQRSWRVLRPSRHRQRLQPRGVGRGPELDPDEEPALGTADLDVGGREHLPEAAKHRISLGAIDVSQELHVRFHVVAQIPGRDARHERAHPTAEVEGLERRQHRARGAEPPEPHARAEDLRERAGPDHPAASVQRVDGRLRLTLEPELAVRVVFEDEGVVLLGELDQLLAAAERQVGTRRVLEVHDRIDELAPAALPPEPLEALAHHARDHALGVHGDIENLWAVPPDGVERPGERGRFADDRVVGVHERAEREREGVA